MTFPVTESTLSAFDLGKFVEKKYHLSSGTTCTLFRTGMNHSYQVTDGESKFILRVYTLNWRTQTEIAEELRLLNHLKQHAINVAFPIADREGHFIQSMNAPEGVRYCVLFSFAEGEKVSKFTAATSYYIGQTMARLHEVTRNFKVDRVNYNSKSLLVDPLIRTKAFFKNTSDEVKFVESATDYLKKEFDKVTLNDVRHGAIHLDIWFDNMHLKGEENITIFDFDFCGNGWLCCDIAYFTFQLFNTNPDENDFKQKLESFLKGYEKVTAISEEEKRLLPILGIAIFIFYLGVQCTTFDTWSNIFLNNDHLKRVVGTMKRWADYNNLQFKPVGVI